MNIWKGGWIDEYVDRSMDKSINGQMNGYIKGILNLPPFLDLYFPDTFSLNDIKFPEVQPQEVGLLWKNMSLSEKQ